MLLKHVQRKLERIATQSITVPGNLGEEFETNPFLRVQ